VQPAAAAEDRLPALTWSCRVRVEISTPPVRSATKARRLDDVTAQRGAPIAVA
jgi:hypothetical protein